MKKPFIEGLGFSRWNWPKENPREIILVVFIFVVFAFLMWLPPQGWGIDRRAPLVKIINK